MSNTRNRIEQINAKQRATKLGLADVDGLNDASKTEFDAARDQIAATIEDIKSQLHWSIQVPVRNNDLYWYHGGGLNVFVFGGRDSAMGYFWQDKDGTVFAGGNPFTGETGVAIGTGANLDIVAVENYVLTLIENSI